MNERAYRAHLRSLGWSHMGSPGAHYVHPDGVTHETMAAVARAVLSPAGTVSRPYLCDERSILSQGQYNEWRRRWLEAGLLASLPGNRTELTAAGRSVLRSYRDGGEGDEN